MNMDGWMNSLMFWIVFTLQTSRKFEPPTLRYGKNEASVYGKHRCRRGVFHDGGPECCGNGQLVCLEISHWSYGLLVNDVSRVTAELWCLSAAVVSSCQWIRFTARQPPFSTLPARPRNGLGPRQERERERGRQPLPAKQNLLSPYPLYKNKCLPVVFSWPAVCF